MHECVPHTLLHVVASSAESHEHTCHTTLSLVVNSGHTALNVLSSVSQQLAAFWHAHQCLTPPLMWSTL